MPWHEGSVVALKENGRAEVVVRPESAGIPGASNRVNRHVCHCATDGSIVVIEALNGVGAEIGDYVSVRWDASVAKNAVCLLGVPLVSLISGIILAALLTDGFSLRLAAGVIAVAAFVIAGTVVGALTFRRISPGSSPVIERIIEKSRDGAPPANAHPLGSTSTSTHCSTCPGSPGKMLIS